MLLGLLLLASGQVNAAPLPTRESVGPDALPAEIAPIDAAFEMEPLVRPQFGEATLSIDRFGAQPGLDKLATASIQQCIDTASASGGGRVLVGPGKWLTGRLQLKSGVELHLAEGAELHFSPQIEDYLPAVFCRYEGLEIMGLGGLIYAHGQKNIAITGKGKLVGPPEGPLREIRQGLSDKLVDQQAPIEERVFDGQAGRHYLRPYFICPIDCEEVLIEGVSLSQGPMWNIVPIYCNRVIVRGVTVESRGVGNGDGVNIESSRNVLVEYCSVSTGDDCYALKAGRNADGLRAARPVENVVFRHCHADGGYGGITCGSETAGGVRNIYLHDCLFENVRHATYFKTRRPRGGGVEHVVVERVKFSASNHGLFFDMLGLPIYVGELAKRLPPRELTPATPYYRDITLRQIEGTSEREAFKIIGIPESPATRVRLEQIDIRSRGLINLADVKDVTITNSRFESEQGEIRLLDADGVRFEKLDFAGRTQPPTVKYEGPKTREVTFEGCRPQPGGQGEE